MTSGVGKRDGGVRQHPRPTSTLPQISGLSRPNVKTQAAGHKHAPGSSEQCVPPSHHYLNEARVKWMIGWDTADIVLLRLIAGEIVAHAGHFSIGGAAGMEAVDQLGQVAALVGGGHR